MAVDQERCPGHETWIHTHGFPGIDLDEDEALPSGAIALGSGFQLAQEGFFELENFFDMHARDEGLGGSGGGVSEKNVFEFVAAGWENGCALVHFGRVEQVEHGKMLDRKNFVHAFEAQAALAV